MTTNSNGVGRRIADGKNLGEIVDSGAAGPTHQQLRQIEAALILLGERMRMIRDSLPTPEFEAGTDRPLNTSAEIYGLLSATLEDEVRGAVASLRQAADLSSGSSSPEGPLPNP